MIDSSVLNNFREFEVRIIDEMEDKRIRDPDYDIIDALVDFLEENPKVDPENLKFSDGFKNYIREAAKKRRFIRVPKSEKDSIKRMNMIDLF